MKKKDIICLVADKMREDKMRKPISIPKQTFHISDDEGNQKDFVVKKTDKTVMFTREDVEMFLDTFISVVIDAVRMGEVIALPGFGKIGLKYRNARRIKNIATGGESVAPGHYVPTVSFGNEMKLAARAFEAAEKQRISGNSLLADGRFDTDEDGGDDTEEWVTPHAD